ncbi:hypothetical protein [uncultured Treponema sp.]|uniref:hypothetical protein n=1 Tax=uncultured Treponema sp. TaxID=162155 RepID=UPI0025E8A905|nr:hypothetical protein [uncultured Treponema sp.]
MNTVTSIFIWGGIGFSIGLGFCLVFFVAALLVKFYEKLFPKKKTSPKVLVEQQLSFSSENSIFLSPHFLPLLTLDRQSKAGEKGFNEQMQDFRSELWKKDIVLPAFALVSLPPGCDFSLFVKIEGREIFRGKIDAQNGEKGTIESVISPIKKYFRTLEATKEIQRIENQGEKR